MRVFTNDDVKNCFADGKVVVPSAFSLIHESAFTGCVGVTSVEFLGAVDFNYLAITHGIFKDCPHLKKVVFRLLPRSSISVLKNCTSKEVDIYMPEEYVEDNQKNYRFCKAFCPDSFQTQIHIHSLLDLTKNSSGKV